VKAGSAIPLTGHQESPIQRLSEKRPGDHWWWGPRVVRMSLGLIRPQLARSPELNLANARFDLSSPVRVLLVAHPPGDTQSAGGFLRDRSAS
jgi:hypothetical protein